MKAPSSKVFDGKIRQSDLWFIPVTDSVGNLVVILKDANIDFSKFCQRPFANIMKKIKAKRKPFKLPTYEEFKKQLMDFENESEQNKKK